MTSQVMSPPKENTLQSEATMVERLRREIAALPARGEVASPQLLAEFARAQKSYLDKKIEFEKQRRASGEDTGTAGVEPEKAASEPAGARNPEMLGPIDGVVWADKARSPKKGARLAIIALLVTIGIAVIAWILAS